VYTLIYSTFSLVSQVYSVISQVVEGVRAALIIHDKSASVDFAYCIWCSLSSLSIVLGASLRRGRISFFV